MKKIALTVLLSLLLAPVASIAQVMVRVGPPPPVYERRGPRPDRESVWIGGYHRYDHDHYTWNPGHYERPPREHARWVQHRWEHRRGGWILVEGHWR